MTVSSDESRCRPCRHQSQPCRQKDIIIGGCGGGEAQGCGGGGGCLLAMRWKMPIWERRGIHLFALLHPAKRAPQFSCQQDARTPQPHPQFLATIQSPRESTFSPPDWLGTCHLPLYMFPRFHLTRKFGTSTRPECVLPTMTTTT